MERREPPRLRSNSIRMALEPSSRGGDTWCSDESDQRTKIVVEASGACESCSTPDLGPCLLYSSADADRRVAGGEASPAWRYAKKLWGSMVWRWWRVVDWRLTIIGFSDCPVGSRQGALRGP